MLTADTEFDPSTIHVEFEITFVRGHEMLERVLRPYRMV